MKTMTSLYIHIPFCQQKCNYCSFFSQIRSQNCIELYLKALEKEINSYKNKLKDFQISTIYFGGGTPSLISATDIERLLNLCRQNFNFTNDIEISLEANPESLTFEKLTAYKKMGINRLSIGLQAWQNRLLKYLGRTYQNQDFKEIISLVKQVGFENFNIDLIFGIPKQTFKDWQESLQEAVKLSPTHISCYSLELDNDSAWGKLYKLDKFKAMDEKLDRQMYHFARKFLKQNGFSQYEISNFAKKDFKCQYNLQFWQYNQYIGLGAGASSFFGNKRWQNIASIEDYIKKFQDKEEAGINLLKTCHKREIKEALMLSLRLTSGINISEFNNKFKIDLLKIYGMIIEKLVKDKLLAISKNNLKLTRKGLDLSNLVIVELLE